MLAGPAIQGAPAFAASAEAPPSVPAAAPSSSEPTVTVVSEIVERRSATATHYRLSDGRQRAIIAATPIRFRGTDGPWVDIDTNVHAESPGIYRTNATSLPVTFAPESRTRRPVTIQGDGWSASLDLVGGVEGMPLPAADTVHYGAVKRDTDLTYQSLADGVKETIVLRSSDAAASHTFFLATAGASVEQIPGGDWGIVKDGRVVSRLGAVTAFDSSVGEGGDPAWCPDAKMEVVPTDDGAFVTYSVSQEWLGNPHVSSP